MQGIVVLHWRKVNCSVLWMMMPLLILTIWKGSLTFLQHMQMPVGLEAGLFLNIFLKNQNG